MSTARRPGLWARTKALLGRADDPGETAELVDTTFRAALALNANDSNSNYNLGLSLLALGRQDEAHAAIKRSLILQPTFLKALSLLGRWELQAGRLEPPGLIPVIVSESEIDI